MLTDNDYGVSVRSYCQDSLFRRDLYIRTYGRFRSQPQTPVGSRPGTPTMRRRGGGKSNGSKSRGARLCSRYVNSYGVRRV